MLRIATWNVNGIRAIYKKGELFNFLNKYNPDFLLIQEIKAKQEVLPKELTSLENYLSFYNSAEKAGYSGTSIWVKKVNYIKNITFSKGMSIDNYLDSEGRIARVDFVYNQKKYALLNIYFPNGGKSPQAWEEKLIFYQDFLNYINEIRKSNLECLWAGDLNCAHEAIDIARPKENEGKIGFHIKERQWISQVIAENWVDIWRKTYPKKANIYSWWHVITKARSRNIGWRIDYFFCNHTYFKNIKYIHYINDQFGSDHCPLIVDLL